MPLWLVITLVAGAILLPYSIVAIVREINRRVSR